jgi:hypothetical protein
MAVVYYWSVKFSWLVFSEGETMSETTPQAKRVMGVCTNSKAFAWQVWATQQVEGDVLSNKSVIIIAIITYIY